MKIPLPTALRKEGAQAHPFPFQIALQTQEFLQGMLFHASFADLAAGEFVRQQDGIRRIDQIMLGRGMDERALGEAWSFLGKYRSVFEYYVFQSVVIGLNSHWDWYIRRLSEFIRFARRHGGGPTLSQRDESRLEKAGRLPIGDQLTIVELAAGISSALEPNERQELCEMSLVRNLGLHNRWEIDTDYLKKTHRTGLVEGHLRVVQQPELQHWHSLLIKLLHNTSVESAKRFRAAPDFNI